MFIISGMHRSGTSLVARLFHEAGADMGDPETFYRPDQWNPDGYFEQPDIHAINMPLINGPWGKLAYFRPPSTATIMRRAARRTEQIRATAAKYQDKVVKETRFCLTLPAWTAAGARVTGILVCLRDPIQVARSLQKRNRISIARGLELWRLHNARLLEHATDIPLWFVYYRDILDPQHSAGEVTAAFRFFQSSLPPDEIERIRRLVVKPGMNHHATTTYPYPAPVAKLWEELLPRHAAQSRSGSDPLATVPPS